MYKIKANTEAVLYSTATSGQFSISSTPDGRLPFSEGDYIYARMQQKTNPAVFAEVQGHISAGLFIVDAVLESSTTGPTPSGFGLPTFTGDIKAYSVYPAILLSDKIGDGYAIVLVFGDSNTIGRNAGPLYDSIDYHPGVYQVGRGLADIGNSAGPSVNHQIINVTSPIHAIDAADHINYPTGSVSAIPSFCSKLHAHLGHNQPVVFIHGGMSGQGLQAGLGGGLNAMAKGNQSYNEVIAKCNALKTANPNNWVAAIIYQSGAEGMNSDGTANLKANINKHVGDLRGDIVGNARQPAGAAVPYISFEAPFSAPNGNAALEANRESMLADLRSLPSEISFYGHAQTTMVPGVLSDLRHFNAAALREIGPMLFDAWKEAYYRDLTPQVPGPVSIANPVGENAQISFTLKPVYGTPAVELYEYQVRAQAGSWAPVVSVTAAQVAQTQVLTSGISNGTTYEIQGRARNALGWGAWGAIASVTPSTAKPGNIEGFSISSPGAGEIIGDWNAVPGATSYEYQVAEKGVQDINTVSVQSTTEIAISVTGLKTTGEVYQVRVRASNSGGTNDGDWSAILEAEPSVSAGSGGLIDGTLALDPVLVLRSKTQFYKTDGSTPIATGERVSEWRDLSGKGNHAIAPAGKEPQYHVAGSANFTENLDKVLEIITPPETPLAEAPIGDGACTMIWRYNNGGISANRYWSQHHGWQSTSHDVLYNTRYADNVTNYATALDSLTGSGTGRFMRAMTYDPAIVGADNAKIYALQFGGTPALGETKEIVQATAAETERWSVGGGPETDLRKISIGLAINSRKLLTGWSRETVSCRGYVFDLVIFNKVLDPAEIQTVVDEWDQT